VKTLSNHKIRHQALGGEAQIILSMVNSWEELVSWGAICSPLGCIPPLFVGKPYCSHASLRSDESLEGTEHTEVDFHGINTMDVGVDHGLSVARKRF
jgi:hypothetical protein